MSAPLPMLLLLAHASPAFAGSQVINSVDNGIVIRPDTYVVDTRFSLPPVENFFELYVDPVGLSASLQPASPPAMPDGPKGAMTTGPSFPPSGNLLLINEHMSKAVVTVSGTKVGLVQPLTEAVVHGVKSGCYQVNWAFPDDYDFTEEVCTTVSTRAPFPGGPTAAIYLEEGRPDRNEPEWRYGPPDRDKDGVADADDECPSEPGPAESFGCPDGDGDRVPDYRDECPAKAGPAKADPKRSDGCPARVFVAAKSIEITEKIYFQTAKARIKKDSYGLLDEIAAILVKFDEIKKVEIAGHTDSQGKDDYNMRLSDDRAKAVRDYLVDAGVDAARLDAKGYGETEPKADNETDEGRALNRRVEFRILEQETRLLPARELPEGVELPPAGDGATPTDAGKPGSLPVEPEGAEENDPGKPLP